MQMKPLSVHLVDNRQIINGELGFFCEHCFQPFYAKVKDFSYYFEISPMISYDQVFNFRCARCNHYNQWHDRPLDANITSSIALLNLKGYKTYQSCEGHEFETDDAYILFEHQYFDLRNIPEHWYYDEDFQYYQVYNYNTGRTNAVNCDCIRCDIKKHSLKERITSLYRWVLRLDCKEMD